MPAKFQLTLFITLLTGSAVLAVAGDTIPLSLPTVGVQVVANASADGAPPATAFGPNAPRLVVALRDQKPTVTLFPAADTWVGKGDDKTHGGAANLVLRDGRFSQGLIQFDLRGLPANATIESATLRLVPMWRERPGSARLTFHRVLTAWDDTATWAKPRNEAANWDGLRAGVDYVAEPFATFATDDVELKKPIQVEGFGPALQEWAGGRWPNHGFVVMFQGKAMQINLPSREEASPKPTTRLLGGSNDCQWVVALNVPLLQRVVLNADDLQIADLSFRYSANASRWTSATLRGYRLLRAAGDQKLVAGQDYDATPLIEVAMNDVATRSNATVRITGLAPALRQWAGGAWPDHGLLLTLSAEQAAAVLVTDARQLPVQEITITKHPSVELFDSPVKPRAGVYARAGPGGKLYYGDQRLRLWGVNRHDSPNLAIVDRLHKVGFNAVRLWLTPHLYDKSSLTRGELKSAAPGQPGPLDSYDRFVAEIKNHGMFVWAILFESRSPLHPANLEGLTADDSFVAGLGGGAADWRDWQAAMRTKKAPAASLMYFDERSRAAWFRHAANILEHVNPYTGKRYAEEEAVAVWQVTNENGFTYGVLERGVKNWPEYFQKKLQARWNAWLQARYGGDDKLRAAWGALPDGESLQQQSVQLGPTLPDRVRFPEARGDDFVRFMVDIVVAFNRDFHEHCRTFAPAGVGVNVAPFVFDCQYRPSLPWLATQALAGDTVSMSTYQWAFRSSLTGPPGMYMLDNHTVQNKMKFVYETNSADTNPFRAEFPFRIAGLAAQQDWDGIFWHIYHAPNERNTNATPDEVYLLEKLPYIQASHYWTGTHFAGDPAMGTAIALAGRIFLYALIPTPTDLAIVRVGDRGLYSYQNFNGLNLRADTFRTGTRIEFQPGSPTDVEIQRPAVAPTNPPVVYDSADGRMIIDTPTVNACIGQTAGAPFRFRNGIVVGGFNQPFAAFALVSADGRPLTGDDAAKRMFIGAVDNAWNTDFAMNMAIGSGAGHVAPLEQAAATKNYGRAPILVDPVAYEIWFPRNLTGQYAGYDFALRQITAQPVTGTNVQQWAAARESFLGVLTVTQRDGPAPVPAARSFEYRLPVAETVATGATGDVARAAAGIWNPLPGLDWDDSFALAHQKMREGNFARSGVSGSGSPKGPDDSFVISGAEVVFRAPADITVEFKQGRMTTINVVFVKPPALAEAVAAYEQQFGKPAGKTIAAQFETSTIRWRVEQPGAELAITMTEVQGVLSITYEIVSKKG